MLYIVCTCTERVNRLHQIIHIIHTERVGGAGTAITGAGTGAAITGAGSISAFNGRVLVSDSGDGDDEYSDGDYSDEDGDEDDDEYNSDNDYSDDEGKEDTIVLGTGDNADLLLAVPRDVTLDPVEEPDAVHVVVNKASPKKAITLDIHLEDVEELRMEDMVVEEADVEEADPRTNTAVKKKMTLAQLRSTLGPDFPHENLSKMNKTQLLQLFNTKYPDS
jgi:hypothetical protein